MIVDNNLQDQAMNNPIVITASAENTGRNLDLTTLSPFVDESSPLPEDYRFDDIYCDIYNNYPSREWDILRALSQFRAYRLDYLDYSPEKAKAYFQSDNFKCRYAVGIDVKWIDSRQESPGKYANDLIMEYRDYRRLHKYELGEMATFVHKFNQEELDEILGMKIYMKMWEPNRMIKISESPLRRWDLEIYKSRRAFLIIKLRCDAIVNGFDQPKETIMDEVARFIIAMSQTEMSYRKSVWNHPGFHLDVMQALVYAKGGNRTLDVLNKKELLYLKNLLASEMGIPVKH